MVLCLRGSDVGPRPDADNPTALSYNLQPVAWLHSAQLETSMYACLMRAQQCDENTKAFSGESLHSFSGSTEQNCLPALSNAFVMWFIIPNKQCSPEISFK